MADFYGKMKAEKILRSMGIQPKYKVLQADMLRPSDKEKAAAITAFITSGDDAYKLAGHDGFAYRDLDIRRKCGVVLYKGVEVALLFKREVIEREPGPADPVPEKVINDPKDAWLQIDLLNTTDVTKEKGIADRLQKALAQVSRLQTLWTAEEHGRKNAEAELEKWLKKDEELKGLREKTALQSKEKELLTEDLERLKRQVREEKDARKDDKINIVREMFPVFNTVWLAGLHRVGDKLYDILKKQLVDALGKIGIQLVEPQVGDEFDPELHHAVHAKAYPEEAKEVGQIVEVFRFGWKLKVGAVQEPADVAVGVAMKSEEKGESSNGESSNGESSSGSSSGDSVSLNTAEVSGVN